MKILFCLNHFFPDRIAGTEVYVESLVSKLIIHGVQCEIVIPHQNVDKTEIYFHNDIKITKFSESRFNKDRLHRGNSFSYLLPNFSSILQGICPDIVHFHEVSGGQGITLRHVQIAKELGFKTFMTFHLAGHTCITGQLRYKGKKECDGQINLQRCTSCMITKKAPNKISQVFLPLFSFLFYKFGINTSRYFGRAGTALSSHFQLQSFLKKFHLLIQATDRFVVLTEWYRNMLKLNQTPEDKMTVCKSAASLCIPMVGMRGSKKKTLRLFYGGRICYDKGLHLLIQAVSRMKDFNITLHIYGQIIEEEYAKDLMRHTMDSTNIGWKGVLARDQFLDVLTCYDAVCVPSLLPEMSSLIIHEALGVKLSVIAADCPGNREIINDYPFGFLFQPNNVNDLIQAINSCRLAGSNLQTSDETDAKRNFQNIALEHISLYKNFLHENSFNNGSGNQSSS